MKIYQLISTVEFHCFSSFQPDVTVSLILYVNCINPEPKITGEIVMLFAKNILSSIEKAV